jgi:hypothetical protein
VHSRQPKGIIAAMGVKVGAVEKSFLTAKDAKLKHWFLDSLRTLRKILEPFAVSGFQLFRHLCLIKPLHLQFTA